MRPIDCIPMETSGLLNVFKPVGMTSHDVVAWVRRRLDAPKVGHAGTLDPAACGVLVILVGSDATRLSSLLAAHDKRYRVEATFGIRTDTGDVEGKILESRRVEAGADEIARAARAFVATIQQIPPMTSAIKIGGKKLYKLAHRGISVERQPRTVTIHDMRLLEVYHRGGRRRALLDVECSSGTYIRTLIEDMGKALGAPACVTFLLRTRSGIFDLRNSTTLDKLSPQNVEKHLIPVRAIISDEPRKEENTSRPSRPGGT